MLFWASTQVSEPILECFGSISYHFRDSEASLTAETRDRGGLPPVAGRGGGRILAVHAGSNEKEST